ncbi:hypothetical protein Droror1_Dr00005229 [Drosera rotundifolia]
MANQRIIPILPLIHHLIHGDLDILLSPRDKVKLYTNLSITILNDKNFPLISPLTISEYKGDLGTTLELAFKPIYLSKHYPLQHLLHQDQNPFFLHTILISHLLRDLISLHVRNPFLLYDIYLLHDIPFTSQNIHFPFNRSILRNLNVIN